MKPEGTLQCLAEGEILSIYKIRVYSHLILT